LEGNPLRQPLIDRQPSPVNIRQNGLLATMNQTQLQRLQTLDSRQQFNKRNKDDLKKLLLLGLAIILNITCFPKENPACEFESTWFNRVFLYYVLLPEVLLRLVFLGFWRTSRYLVQRKTILYVTAPCLYTAWFLLTMAHYREFTPNCYEPYPSYGLFVFCICMVLIMPAAFLVICIVSFLILFCPCISYTLGKAYYD
jgi:hypothetical protein